MTMLRCRINGREGSVIHAASRGLQYGDGLFETLPIQDGRLFLWRQHLARLTSGAQRLGMALPDGDLLTREAKDLAGDVTLAILKVLYVRAAGGRGYRPGPTAADRILTLWPWAGRPRLQEGTDLRWCETRLARQPRLAGLKHLNRLEQVLAQQELGDLFWEGLMQDTEGWVVEGTLTNLFLGEGHALITPALDQAGVAGVMREQVMMHARALGIPVAIEPVSRDRVLGADEIFLTNSVLGICPVRSLPERAYLPGPLTSALQDALLMARDAPAF